MKTSPQFPITVRFTEDGENWTFIDSDDAACNLEWFDSEDMAENVSVLDCHGRSVRLKIERLKVVICELK